MPRTPEYCHGHNSPEPLPVRLRESSRVPTPVALPAPRVVTPESGGSQAESLARNLINAILQHHNTLDNDAPDIEEDNEDTATLPPPYLAEGVEVRGGRRGRRGRGNRGGEEAPYAFSTSRRSSRRPSITPEGGRELRAHPYLKTGRYPRKGSCTTEGPRTSLSTSTTTTGAKSPRALSKRTCKARIPTQ